MDTIVIATGIPFFLAFLDQDIDEVVAMWESWTRSGEWRLPGMRIGHAMR